MIANQRLDQRRFTRAVRPNETEPITAHQRRRHVVDQHSVADLDGRMLSDRDPVTAALRDIEPYRHRCIVRHRRAESRHALESFAATLGLLAVLTREVASDVIALAGDFALLLLVLPMLREAAKCSLL